MKRKKAHKLKSAKKIALIIATISLLIGGYQAYIYFRGNFFTPTGETVYIYIKEKTTFDELIKQIEKKTKPRSIRSFISLAKSKGYPQKIRTGRYAIDNGMSNHALLHDLQKHIQAPVKLKFNNIRTKEQLAGRLAKQLMVDSLSLLTTLNDSAADAKLGFNNATIVAMFIPNTYDILWDITPAQLIKRMHNEYNDFWTDERKEKAKAAHLSPIEATTLASIIEEETNNKADKAIVAGLYMNRLRIKMPLQSCPTIKFALNDFSLQRITGKHLRVNSPYNTYKNPGLPPGPIRIPSIESIDAVLNFKPNTYIYMCAKETLNGEHYFASTWEEHRRNAARYAAMMNKRGIH